MIIKDSSRITKNPLVTVQVFAYNKEAYIRQCLDSIINQRVTFEFEVIVSENPGTDNTRNICLEYQRNNPDKIILVLREENKGLFYNYFEAEIMSRGKFIARCDGDDYWCDLFKLQKQVDALEKDFDLGLCYTNCCIFDESIKQFRKNTIGGEINDFKSLLMDYPIAQPSVMYRKDLCQQYFNEVNPQDKDWLMEDFPRHIWFFLNSHLVYLKDLTTVYRVVSNSMSHNLDEKKQEKYFNSIYDIKLYFIKKYNLEEGNIVQAVTNHHYRKLMLLYFTTRNLISYYSYYKKYKYDGFKDFIRINGLFIKLIIVSGYGKLFKNY